MSDDPIPPYWSNANLWPTEVREFALRKLWQRQRQICGPVTQGGKIVDGTDGDVLEGMFRNFEGFGPQARAEQIWPHLVAEARAWKAKRDAKGGEG